MKWEEKYRPRKFGDVRGQNHAVQQLSGLIRHGRIEKHIALLGAVGSGKTSLIRLYARALNCLAVETDGSPCGACEYCREPQHYLHEYDTAGLSGSKEDVLGFVRAKDSRFAISRTQVIFFDEVHAMNSLAQEGLLISIQEARPGLIFCVATTERKKLKPALLSRLLDIDIQALTPEVAFEHLEFIAKRENLSYEPAALRLLAAARPPYARDLVIALEGLGRLNQHITVELVKKHYDLGVCDHLPQYAMALASGDRAEQFRVLRAWQEDAAEKRRWIELFICATYYNNVIGHEYVVDPLVHYLAEARLAFVEQLRKRLGVDTQGLSAAFESMMEFWSLSNHNAGSDASLAIALFGALVSRCPITSGYSTEKPIENFTKGDAFVENVRTFRQGDESTSPAAEGKSRFLNARDARQVVNRISFFNQHYGKPMNASARIEFAGIVPDLEASAEDSVVKLMNDLERHCGGAATTFASLAVLERDGGMLVGRFVAYVDDDLQNEFEQFCRGWRSLSSRIRDFRTCSSSSALAFQWKAVRELCAGCEPESESEDADLRQKLAIPKVMWRTPGPIDCTQLYFSERLTARSIENACFPEMRPLSAFDARQWKWVTRGWEVKEYFDRRSELRRRQSELTSLERRWKSDSERLNFETAERLRAWSDIEAERRTRRWRGWW